MVVVVVSHFIVVGSYVVFLLFGKIFLHNNYTVSCLRFTCHSDMVPCVCVCVCSCENKELCCSSIFEGKKIYVAVRYIFGLSLLCMCCYSFFIFWSTWSKWKLSLTQSEFKVKKIVEKDIRITIRLAWNMCICRWWSRTLRCEILRSLRPQPVFLSLSLSLQLVFLPVYCSVNGTKHLCIICRTNTVNGE